MGGSLGTGTCPPVGLDAPIVLHLRILDRTFVSSFLPNNKEEKQNPLSQYSPYSLYFESILLYPLTATLGSVPGLTHDLLFQSSLDRPDRENPLPLLVSQPSIVVDSVSHPLPSSHPLSSSDLPRP
ncbi:hypothetical protein N7510_007144 [Penicillium lagena]|uniref:uncharacterized protein n=1 Tax=Penicillium lagena TaxID=94218 RepID=UPI00254167AA|nr:uncharacterized protein N7510_007144 [Penicillium lagena]KAJ5610425.1 hypothetical protein N7510_007144 [Penicillium lagena]